LADGELFARGPRLTMGMQTSDEELAGRFAAGDRAAFDALVRRHKDRVYRFVLCQGAGAADAEDVAQEVFIQLFRSAASFRGDSSFVSWLYALTRNVHLTHRRRRAAIVERCVELEHDEKHLEIPDGAPPLDQALEREERRRALKAALDALPAIHREAILLKDVEGLSYQEIAHALGIPLGTVRSRIHNATAALLTAWERREIQEAANELPRS